MNIRFWLSGVIALCIEISIVVLIFFALLPKVQRQYTSSHKTTLDFLQIENVIEEKKPEPKRVKTNHSTSKVVEKKKQILIPKTSPKIGTDVRKLFEKIDSSNPPVREENVENERPLFSANTIKTQDYSYSRDNTQMHQESLKIQNALDSLWENELEVSAPEVVDISEGEYDEWFAKIKTILYGKWKNRFYESVAIVVSIKIESDGSFNYRVIRPSKNDAYNIYMENLLAELKNEKFPPYPKGKITLEVTFKTKEQDDK